MGETLELWRLTRRGTGTWTGALVVPDLEINRIHDVLISLRQKRAIDWRHVHNAREFKMLARPEDIRVIRDPAPRKPGEPKERERWRDEGDFSQAWARAGLERFEDNPRLPARLPVYRPSRPDARVLTMGRG